MKLVSDNSLLNMLKKGDNAAFALLYDHCFSSIRTHVVNNSGTAEDAEDIFQESILVLYRKIQSDSFVLSSPIAAYLFSVARNIWLNRLRMNRNLKFQPIQSLGIEPVLSEDVLEPEDQLERWIQKITDHCQWILTSFYYMKMPLEILMEKTGWKNKHTASNQKYKCIQMLKKEALKEAGL